jgi:hypothetical protein
MEQDHRTYTKDDFPHNKKHPPTTSPPAYSLKRSEFVFVIGRKLLAGRGNPTLTPHRLPAPQYHALPTTEGCGFENRTHQSDRRAGRNRQPTELFFCEILQRRMQLHCPGDSVYSQPCCPGQGPKSSGGVPCIGFEHPNRQVPLC